jgi:hypothetical protein
LFDGPDKCNTHASARKPLFRNRIANCAVLCRLRSRAVFAGRFYNRPAKKPRFETRGDAVTGRIFSSAARRAGRLRAQLHGRAPRRGMALANRKSQDSPHKEKP